MIKFYIKRFPTYILIILYGSFFYLLHAQVTEHVGFALVQIGEIKFTPQNFYFNFISKEPSAQITLAAILLKMGFNKYLLLFFLSWLFTLIPFIAIWEFSKNSKSPYIFFLFFTSLLICFQMPNWYFYPYSIQLGFYAFGNIGFWIFILFFGLLLQRKSTAYLISGLLVSIHIPWGILSILFLGIDQVRFGINKKLLKHFLYGICTSGLLLFISFIFINSIQSNESHQGLIEKIFKLIKPIKLSAEQYPFYAFDPFIWNNSHNPYIFYSGMSQAAIILFNLFLPSFLINIRVGDLNLEKFRNQIAFYINLLSIFVLIGLIYMELARIFPLPFVDMLWRIIINRYLNVASFVGLLFIAIYLFNSIFYNKEKLNATFFIFLSAFIYLFNYELAWYLLIGIAFLYVAFAFYKSQISLLIKRLLLLAAFAPLVYMANFPSSNFYTTLAYLDNHDSIFNYLENNQSRDILLGPHVQSNNGIDVSLISGKAFYVLSEMNYSIHGEDKSVYCYKNNIDYKSLVANAERCFQERTREDWEKIFKQLNISSVMVFNRNKLNLDLVAKNNIFSIYSIDVRPK